MDAKESIEHFDAAHTHAGHLTDPDVRRLVRNAAILVAVMAAFLAIATFLANEEVKIVITSETKAADASTRLEANDVKTTIADHDAALMRVIAAGDAGEAEAARGAAELDRKIVAHYKPIDERLEHQVAEYQHDRDHAEDRHLLAELAAVGLQIGIVLASISIIARRRWLLLGGSGVGVAAVGLLAAAFLT